MTKYVQSIEITEAEFPALLGRARAGDREALDRLFAGFYESVSTMVHVRLAKDQRIGRPWLVARFSTGDVVQEVFRDLLLDLEAFRGTTADAFRGYLAMMVRNRLVDAIRFHQAAQRDGRRTASRDDVEGPAQMPDPQVAAELAEERGRFERALDTFEQRERLLLRGRIELSSSFRDLAAQLGYPSPVAAKRAFYLAQARLVIRMKGSGEPHA